MINHQLYVPLIKSYMGMGSDLLEFYANQGVDGIVVEALGKVTYPLHVYMDLSKSLITTSLSFLFQDRLTVL